jgi:hypothetical protein
MEMNSPAYFAISVWACPSATGTTAASTHTHLNGLIGDPFFSQNPKIACESQPG